MNKCDLAKEFKDIMELASPITRDIRFSAEDLGYSIAVKIISDDTIVISNAKCKSGIINSIIKSLSSYTRNIDDFIDMVCDDKSVIDFSDEEIKSIPAELISRIEKFNDTILNYNSYEEEKCAAIKEKILSWTNCKSCSGIRVYTSSLELVSFLSKTFSNKRNSHVRMQMLAEKGSELSSLFCGSEVPIIDTDYKCIPIELVAKEVFNEELVMVPIMSCSNDDATIINNYSVLINSLLDKMRVNVYAPGKLKVGCIISVSYSVTSNNGIIFVNINVNKEFKDHDYIENVVNAGLEKYGIDGTLISLFNLSQLILEKGWVF